MIEVQVLDDGAVAVAESGVANFDASHDVLQMLGFARLGHAGNAIQNVEYALGAGSRSLCHRNDAAHRIQARIEAADVGEEGGQHADADPVVRHLPDAERPHHQQTDLGEQGHAGREQRPDLVDAVIDGQIVPVHLVETRRLAFFLGECLDHADAGNGVGQYIADLRPDAVDLFKTGAEFLPDRDGSSRRSGAAAAG